MKIHDDVLAFGSSKKMPLMKIPVVSTAIRTSRGVILIGPGDQLKKHEVELETLGRVTDIVAPNLYHHESIHLAQQIFPQATVWGVEGFKKKRPDVPWDKVLNSDSWNYSDEIQVHEIQGHKMNEVVFFHLKSKTLVVTDLFFNLTKPEGVGAWLILTMFGTYKKFAISSLYMKYVSDLTAFKNSLRKIANWDFQTIVMSHGEPVTQDARFHFERALQERDLL